MGDYKNKKLSFTEKLMLCSNCGFPVIQTEVVENYGYCPNCDTILIEREYYTTTIQHLKNGKCDVCGNDINIVF